VNKDKLDKPLDQSVSTLLAAPDVLGVVVTDKQGLALSVKGNATAAAGAFLTSLSARARELSDKEDPVVVLDTDTSKILVTTREDVTVSVFKRAQ